MSLDLPASANSCQCARCGSTFPSRSRLFSHLRETGCAGELNAPKGETERAAFIVGYLGNRYKGAACQHQDWLLQGSDSSNTRYSKDSLEGVLFRAIDVARRVPTKCSVDIDQQDDQGGIAETGTEARIPARVFRKRPARRGANAGNEGNQERHSFCEAGRAPALSRAGRTDRGFHAEGNVFAMQLERLVEEGGDGDEDAPPKSGGKTAAYQEAGEERLRLQFVAKVNDFLQQQGLGGDVTVLERITVTNQFHAKNSSDTKRYDCLVPSRVLYPSLRHTIQADSTTPTPCQTGPSEQAATSGLEGDDDDWSEHDLLQREWHECGVRVEISDAGWTRFILDGNHRNARRQQNLEGSGKGQVMVGGVSERSGKLLWVSVPSAETADHSEPEYDASQIGCGGHWLVAQVRREARGRCVTVRRAVCARGQWFVSEKACVATAANVSLPENQGGTGGRGGVISVADIVTGGLDVDGSRQGRGRKGRGASRWFRAKVEGSRGSADSDSVDDSRRDLDLRGGHVEADASDEEDQGGVFGSAGVESVGLVVMAADDGEERDTERDGARWEGKVSMQVCSATFYQRAASTPRNRQAVPASAPDAPHSTASKPTKPTDLTQEPNERSPHAERKETHASQENIEPISEWMSRLKLVPPTARSEMVAARMLQDMSGTRRWHNCATAVSPSDPKAKRKVHSAKVSGSVVVDGMEFVVLSFSSHSFLFQQVQKMVAVVVLGGVSGHYDLPKRIIDTDQVWTIPPAPAQNCFLSHCSFRKYAAQQRFERRQEEQWGGQCVKPTRADWRSRILARIRGGEGNGEGLQSWVQREVSDSVLGLVERIRGGGAGGAVECKSRVEGKVVAGDESGDVRVQEVEAACAELLGMLQAITQEGRWPKTSNRRRLLLRTATDESVKEEEGENGGSFTMGLTLGEKGHPHSNAELPHVLDAVMRLEKLIAPHRPPSTTVAINRNAQFVAHTDKGSGAGQSRSLIVGMGDYDGGELVVEGAVKNIRYRPVEFNGWKERHWTLPFSGQRFSIVWFTPKGLELQQSLLCRGVSFPVAAAASSPCNPTDSLRLGSDDGGAAASPHPCDSTGGAVRDGRLFAVKGQEAIRMAFGTFKLKGQAATEGVEAALRCGYRAIDTASVYKNEEQVAAGLSRSGVSREDCFIISKLAPSEQGYEKALVALSESLRRLGTNYLDLYLIHWPGTSKMPLASAEHALNRLESWRALEDAVGAGLIRAIGVSNFEIQHIQQLMQTARIRPAVNQVELHPLFPQRRLAAECQRHGIPLQAYSPLGSADGCDTLFSLPEVVAASDRRGVSPAQVLLSWGLGRCGSVVVKSGRQERMRENLEAASVQLDESEMRRLDLAEGADGALDNTEDGAGLTCKKFCWDPANVA